MGSRPLAEKPESAAINGFRVSNGSGNGELNFRARSGLAPEIQLRLYSFRAFTDAEQPPVSGALAFLQDSRVNALPIISDTQAKRAIVVPDLGFDLTGACVAESIA